MIDIDALSPSDAAILPVKMQWQLVHYWRDSGQFDRAEALIDENFRRTGPSLTVLMERGRLALARGDVRAAAVFARERCEVSETASAVLDLIKAELAAGNISEARDLAKRHRALSGSAQPDRPIDAEIALAAGELDRAEQIYRRLLAGEFNMTQHYLGLARVALARGDQAGVRECLDLVMSEPASLDDRRAADVADLWDALGEPERAALFRARAAAAFDAAREQLAREVAPRLASLPTLGSDAVDFSSMATEEIRADSTLDIDPSVLASLARVFGFDALRPGQANVVSRVMAGKDALAIMPTGSGKSLTFQLPSLLLPGVTIVISPLIALMKDQVDSLPDELRRQTRLINSTLSSEEMDLALGELMRGTLKLVYVAPERLRDRAFLQALKRTRVSLAVVDEAHCISLWGQDFRPDYLFIPRAVKEMGNPPVLAVTATATPEMAKQIASALGRELEVCRVSLFRPNLFYDVRMAGTREFKIREMVDICRNERGSGIVYVNSRKDTEAFAALLRDNKINAIHYHAGMDPDIRSSHQDRFMSGQVRVVVATIAFGMGVDKANVRFIIHFNPPASLEAYAQESGRAGRDGDPAKCILLATRTDETRLKTFTKQDVINKEDLRRVYANLKRYARGKWVLLDRLDTDRLGGVGDGAINSRVALGLMEQAALINRHPDVPRTIAARWNPSAANASNDPRWTRLMSWLGPDGDRGNAVIDVASACNALSWTPFELDDALENGPETALRDGPRLTCVELLDAGPDAGKRVDELLARVDALSERRIHQVIAYTKKRECRHKMLAAQFGERLPPCGSSCDVCAGDVRAGAIIRERDAPPAKSALSGPDAALAILDAVRTMPFPVGRTGLVRLVMGSAESRIQADRSASFGILKGMKKGAVEKLVDRLIELGYLYRDMSHEYFLISLTDLGSRASHDELGRHFMAVQAPAEQNAEPNETLLAQLRQWRADRARKDDVPAYVVAHNSALESVAALDPTTLDELEQMPGFGPVKTAKYGADILRVLQQSKER